MKHDVIVIGAGPAGLMAAISAANNGSRVMVFEQMSRPGLKLLASGGGKCNLTNILPVNEFAARFGTKRAFVLPALRRFTNDDLLEFFATRGIPASAADGFHYFPDCGRASALLEVLLRECAEVGVVIRNDSAVEKLEIVDGRIRGVFVAREVCEAPHVIIATGGRGYPKLGGGISGYELARQAGHQITSVFPGLCGLITTADWPGQCAGISLSEVSARLAISGASAKPEIGELLFTHRGVSGPAIINLAATAAAQLSAGEVVTLVLNLCPASTIADWQEIFNQWQRQHGKKMIKTLLATEFPATLAGHLSRLAGCEECKAAVFSGAARNRLLSTITALELPVCATEDWDKAMVTGGGVALSEVNPHTMAGRITAGVYFAGEVLDIDGPCGGFNLQWAFSSGFLAGMGKF